MTVNINIYWMHGAMTLGTLLWLIAIIKQAGDYDCGSPVRAAVPIIIYLVYWIVYLALT